MQCWARAIYFSSRHRDERHFLIYKTPHTASFFRLKFTRHRISATPAAPQLCLIVMEQSPSLSYKILVLVFYFKSRVFSIIQEVAFYYEFKSKFGSEMAPFFARHSQRAIFFTFGPSRRAPPLVPATGAVALKVAQVPSTAFSDNIGTN